MIRGTPFEIRAFQLELETINQSIECMEFLNRSCGIREECEIFIQCEGNRYAFSSVLRVYTIVKSVNENEMEFFECFP